MRLGSSTRATVYKAASLNSYVLKAINERYPKVGSPLLRAWASALRIAAQVSDSGQHIHTPKVISHKRHFVFISIRKSASQSLISFLTSDPDDEVEITNAPLDDVLGSDADSYYKFAFVRNPYARAVSVFSDKVLDPSGSGQLMRLMKYPGLSGDMDFISFARWLNTPEGSDRLADDHWISQHLYVTGPDGNIACDHVGKIEDVGKHIKEIGRDLGIKEWASGKQQVGMNNSSARASATPHAYRDRYNDETRELIAKRYERDLELFSYEF